MMTFEEMKEYLLAELKEEREKMLKKQGSNYSYIFMLCNDMGLIDPAKEMVGNDETRTAV